MDYVKKPALPESTSDTPRPDTAVAANRH
jgi:hypothetical protein